MSFKLTRIRKKGQKEKESTEKYYHAPRRLGTLTDLSTASSYFTEFDIFKHEQLHYMINDGIKESFFKEFIMRLVCSYKVITKLILS